MDWDDLRYVLAVGRSGSLGDAARALGVAHSTVYRRIGAFESEHGVRVFERLATGYELTDAGRELVGIAERIERSVAEAERKLVGRDAELKGEVRVAAPEALGERLCALLPEFHRSFPDVQIRISASPDMADLSRREADVALRVVAQPPESLVGRKIADIAFAVYGRRELAGAGLEASWVVFDDTLGHTPQAKWEAANVAPEKIRARLGSRTLFVATVRAGTGIGILPCGVGDQEPSLVRIGAPIAELDLPLWMLTHPDLKSVPRVRVFMDFLGKRLTGV